VCDTIGNECVEVGEQDEPCVSLVAETCGEDLFCDRETETCVPLAGEGAECNPAMARAGRPSCLEGYYCECTDNPGCGATSSEPNPYEICVERFSDGEGCTASHQCLSGACVNSFDGLVCGDPDDLEAIACAGP
jgi:hypothetical protein